MSEIKYYLHSAQCPADVQTDVVGATPEDAWAWVELRDNVLLIVETGPLSAESLRALLVAVTTIDPKDDPAHFLLERGAEVLMTGRSPDWAFDFTLHYRVPEHKIKLLEEALTAEEIKHLRGLSRILIPMTMA